MLIQIRSPIGNKKQKSWSFQSEYNPHETKNRTPSCLSMWRQWPMTHLWQQQTDVWGRDSLNLHLRKFPSSFYCCCISKCSFTYLELFYCISYYFLFLHSLDVWLLTVCVLQISLYVDTLVAAAWKKRPRQIFHLLDNKVNLESCIGKSSESDPTTLDFTDFANTFTKVRV